MIPGSWSLLETLSRPLPLSPACAPTPSKVKEKKILNLDHIQSHNIAVCSTTVEHCLVRGEAGRFKTAEPRINSLEFSPLLGC